MLRAAAVLLLAASLPVVAASPAGAMTITVDTTTDLADPTPGDSTCGSGAGTCSLRAAIQTANAVAGADTISLPAGTYTLSIEGTDEDAGGTGDLDVTESLAITGADDATTVIDADGIDRVVEGLGVATTLDLSGLTLTGGSIGGVRVAGAALRLDGTTITGNSGWEGSGVSVYYLGPPTAVSVLDIVESHIDGNHANDELGAVFLDAEYMAGGGIGPTATVTDSTIDDNTSEISAGAMLSTGHATVVRSSVSRSSGTDMIWGFGLRSAGVTAVDSTFDDNSGTGIDSSELGPVTLTGVSASGNAATGVHAPAGASLTDSTVSGNAQGITGGGALEIADSSIEVNGGAEWAWSVGVGLSWSEATTVTIARSTVAGNVHDDNPVGGIEVVGGGGASSFAMEGSTVSGNGGEFVGGMRVEVDEAAITSSAISGNIGAGSGGLQALGGTLTVESSTLARNVGAVGGLLVGSGATLSMISSTVDRNTGGIAIGGDAGVGTHIVRSSTITGNSGWGIANGQPLQLEATVLASSGGPACTSSASITSSGYNYATDATCGLGGAPGDGSAGTDPLLWPLADNGGATPTRLPAAGSPLVDAIPAAHPLCAGADQRGVARPIDGDASGSAQCDIGAVEAEALDPLQPLRLAVDTTADTIDAAPGDAICADAAGECSLRAAVTEANESPFHDLITVPSGSYVLTRANDDLAGEDLNATGDLDIRGDLTITGEATATTVIDADGLDRVFDVLDVSGTPPELLLADLKITGGSTGGVGGGIHSQGHLGLDGVDVIGNLAGSGGGIGFDSLIEYPPAGADIVRSHIDGNTATAEFGPGAGIYIEEAWNATIRLVDSTVDANSGGGLIGSAASDVELVRSSVSSNSGTAVFAGDVTLTDATLEGNDVEGWWVVVAQGSLTVLRSSLSNNDGIAAEASGPVSIIDSTVDGNASGIGVGGFNPSPSVLVSRSSISGNGLLGLQANHVGSVSIIDSHIDDNGGTASSSYGASGVTVQATVGTVSIADTSIDGNGSAAKVGGLLVEGGVTTLLRTSISGNAGFGVGGASIRAGTVTDSTIANNAGVWVGGLEGGPLSVTATTVSGNTSSAGIGGIRASGSLAFVTLADNEGTTFDAAHLGGAVTVEASVFAGTGPNPLCGGTGVLTSLGASYATDGSCGVGAGVGDVSGGADPMLGPLADNGGPTLTRLPAIGSPLLEAMPTSSPACTGADQRGVARPQALRCDIGAVEVALVPAQVFTDIAPSHAIFSASWWGWARGIAGGYADGSFRPGAPLSRQAAMAWMWRAAGSPAPLGQTGFSDVGPAHQFAAAIAWADEEGVSNGYVDGTFRPTAPVTRQAMVAWLWQLAGSPVPTSPPSFPDVAPTHPFAAAIGWAVEEGIVSGYSDGTFRPSVTVSRRAAIVWLYRRP